MAKNKRKIKLSDDFHQDLSWWSFFVDCFNYTPMCDLVTESHVVSLLSDELEVFTEMEGVCSVVKFPCVYVLSSLGDFRMDLSLSGDDFIGCSEVVTNNDLAMSTPNMELFLPNSIVNDNIAIEVCATWAFLLNAKLSNCCVRIICHRKVTWQALKKKRYKCDYIAMVLRHIFWWCMKFNVKLNVVYESLTKKPF